MSELSLSSHCHPKALYVPRAEDMVSSWPYPLAQYHMRIHKEERKYLCPDCGYKCKWVNQLKYHMTKHTGECCPLRTSCGHWGRVLGLLHASSASGPAGDGGGHLGGSTLSYANGVGAVLSGGREVWVAQTPGTIWCLGNQDLGVPANKMGCRGKSLGTDAVLQGW